MKWILLVLAGLLEITWACAMKYSQGFTQLVPSVVTAVSYMASAVSLSFALKELPLGTAYAMWTGFGIAGTTYRFNFATASSMVCMRVSRKMKLVISGFGSSWSKGYSGWFGTISLPWSLYRYTCSGRPAMDFLPGYGRRRTPP